MTATANMASHYCMYAYVPAQRAPRLQRAHEPAAPGQVDLAVRAAVDDEARGRRAGRHGIDPERRLAPARVEPTGVSIGPVMRCTCTAKEGDQYGVCEATSQAG